MINTKKKYKNHKGEIRSFTDKAYNSLPHIFDVNGGNLPKKGFVLFEEVKISKRAKKVVEKTEKDADK